MSCIVLNCRNDPRSRYTMKIGRICEEHWRRLPIALRREFWAATDYGKLDPPQELADRLREALNE